MKTIIEEIFINNGFESILEQRFRKEKYIEGLVDIYVNDYDEMYFVISGELDNQSLDKILKICIQEEEHSFYNKALKSNWIVIYLTELEKNVTREQKNYIMQVEENKFFCRKYVFWYTKEEMDALATLCSQNYTVASFSQKIKDYALFCEFKQKGHQGYECLSRLYIKLPFLNLEQIETTEETILTCIYDELSRVGNGVAELFVEGEIAQILENIDLEPKDLKAIENKIKKVTEEN